MKRSPNGDEKFMENKAFLDYSKLSDGGEVVKPSSIALSEFHFLLLIGNRVKVVNRINEQIVEELHFDQTLESTSKGIIGLSIDASVGLFYAYDENSIFHAETAFSDRDFFRASSFFAKLIVSQALVEQLYWSFEQLDLCETYGYVAYINYALSFEEITLKFISIGEQDALRTFLLRKLDNLVKDDKCQIMMIST
ncbi:hypothetical protein L6452_06084 [Arctium lappa]|uniref:Uncharacterized protein n=1 Tax=Arctium lappa TaxID=4217 RepID=A0ACB9EHW7_ARCLA|nr:hypothetical protein L6452_06084 [Arctium lappa]